ncbi:MAG: ABC transporter permease [Treponema sp.]|uniref:ABC transporter permease n=1 Tax=Treponema sp. TaxID=166 RepID=UPI003FA2280D
MTYPPLFRFAAKRLIISIILLVGITMLLLLLFELQPGNPYLNFIKPGMPPERIEAMLREKGYYDPFSVKWTKMIMSLLRFDFGYSLQYGVPVHTLIELRLPNTLALTVPALFLAIVLSVLIGRRIAFYPHSLFAKSIDVISGIGICTPAFFIALFLIKLFAFDIPLFPISGMEDIGKTGTALLVSRIRYAVLPVTTLTLMQCAPLVRYVRAFMQSVAQEDFIRTYEGFGLTRYAAYKTAGFRAVLPRLITMVFMEVPYLISGALITESIFVWPGIGKLNFDAVQFRDYPVLLGITAMTAVCVLLANLAADLLNYFFDKRMGV